MIPDLLHRYLSYSVLKGQTPLTEKGYRGIYMSHVICTLQQMAQAIGLVNHVKTHHFNRSPAPLIGRADLGVET